MSEEKNRPYFTTNISDVTPEDVYVRGYAIGEMMGKLPFSAMPGLLIRGEIPTPGEARMMDVILCSVLDYSLGKPGTVAARYCVSANPQMVPGLATAVLSVGEYTLSPEDTGRFIAQSFKTWKDSGKQMDEFAAEWVAELRANKQRIPGFGHQVFKNIDPRAQGLKEVAIAQGVWSELCEWYEAVHRAFKAAAGKPEIVINEVGMMAAILAQMGYTPQEMAGIAILSTIPGVIAHISEELDTKMRIRGIPDSIAEYPRIRKDLQKDLAAKGW